MKRIALPLIPSRLWQGGYNYIRSLLVALGRHARGRVEAQLLRSSDSTPEDLAGMQAVGATFVDLPRPYKAGRNRRVLWSLLTGIPDRELARTLRNAQIDAVLENADYFGDRFPLPVLAWVPDLQHRRLRQYFRGWNYWQRELGIRRQIRGGRTVLLSSAAALADCEEFYPQMRGRGEVVRFAIPFEPLPSAEAIASARAAHGLQEEYLFMPNQYWRHKNHRLAMEALASPAAQSLGLRIATCGNPIDPYAPQHYEQLRAKAVELGVADRFLFLGRIPVADLHCLLAGCRGLLNPSLFEGWSTTVEEAKTYGVPLLLSDLPVHREQAGDQGIFFDPHDPASLLTAIQRLRAIPPPARTPETMQALKVAADVRQREFALAFAAVVERLTAV